MPSNMPPGYSEDGDAPSSGEDTAAWQELQTIREKWKKWTVDFMMEMTIEEAQRAETIECHLSILSDNLRLL